MKKIQLILSSLFLATITLAAPNVHIVNWGARSGATSQVALSTTPAQVLPARATRHNLSLRNLDATITIYYGYSASVSSTTGFPLKANESQPLYCYAAIYVVAASGTPTVAIEEEYD